MYDLLRKGGFERVLTASRYLAKSKI